MEGALDLKNVKVTFPDNSTEKYPKPLALVELLKHKSLSSKDIIALMVNGEVKSLNKSISIGVAKVTPILKDSYEGSSCYRRTLVQILATAAYEAYGKEFNIIVHHHVNNGYLVKKADEKDFTEEEINKIKDKMKELIQK